MRKLLAVVFALVAQTVAAQPGPFSAQIQRALNSYPPAFAADPVTCTSTSVPRIYYNTTSNTLKFCNGTVWGDIGSGSSLPVDDGTAVVKGSADATKLLRFEVDGFTTGTTRVATPPNEDFIIATANTAQNITATKTFTGTNGVLLNASNNGGFIAGSTAQTPDTLAIYTGTTSEAVHIKQFGDAAVDQNNCHAGTSASAYPILCVHGAASNTTDYFDVGHDGTNVVLDTGNGIFNFSDAIRAPAGNSSVPGIQITSSAFGAYQVSNAIFWRLAGSDVVKMDGGNYGLSQYAHVVSAHTISFTTAQADSAHIHTNTGASGTITGTLMNNADAGLHWRFILGAAQTMNVAPSSGETMYFSGGATCANLAANTIGAKLECEFFIGGSGGSVLCSSPKPTDWTCT